MYVYFNEWRSIRVLVQFELDRFKIYVCIDNMNIYVQISDLLKPEQNNLTIREDKKRGVFVEGLSEWVRTEIYIYRQQSVVCLCKLNGTVRLCAHLQRSTA